MVERWDREHPTATVVVEVRSFDDHHSAVLESRPGTLVPDVVAFDAAYSARFRDRADLFVDLRALGVSALEGRALDTRWRQGVADDGAVIGIPIDVGALALAYRRDLVGEEAAARFEELGSWCDLLVLGDGYSDVTDQPLLPRAADIFDAVLSQSETRFYDEDSEPIHDSSPAVRWAWDMAIRSLGEQPMFDDPCPEAEGIDRFSANLPIGSSQWGDAIRSGGVAAVIATADGLGEIQTTAPETAGSWRVAPLPGGGAAGDAGLSLAVHAGSNHAELAYDLVAYLADPSSQLRVVSELGPFPAATTLYDDQALVELRREFFGDSSIGSIYVTSARGYTTAPDGPDLRTIQRELRGAVSRVESGTQNPRQAWDEAIWRIGRAIG